MSSHRESSHFSISSSDEFSSDVASPHELPDDLETARMIIESLTRQLKVHDDVTSNLILLHKRIQHAHQRTQDAMQMLEDRLDHVESTWTKELEDQHKRWLDRYNRLMKDVECAGAMNNTKAKSEASGATNADGAGSKLTKNQIESLNRRAKKVGEGLKELAKVASSTKNFDEKLQQDKQRIKDIDARLKALSKKEQSLNAELTKQMNVHFLKPSSQIAEERCEAAFYGVCELVDGYQKAIENLDKALSKLERIREVPALNNINSKVQNIPTVDEIDEIIIVMKRFVAKLRVQRATMQFSGSPAMSPHLVTGKSKSPSRCTLKSDFSEGESDSGSVIRSSSDFGTTPLQSSQSAQSESSTSSAHSQFMALRTGMLSKDMATAKEKVESEPKQKEK